MKYRLGDITVKHWNDWDRVPRMPQVVGNLILGSLGIQATLATAYVVGYIAVTAVTSWALRALSPTPDFSGAGGTRGLITNTRQATAPQEIVYGEVRKGGVVTFLESTGETNQYLHQILVLAGHEVNNIGDIYINDEVVTLDGNGFVTDSKWLDADSNKMIKIIKKTGADNQTAITDLVNDTSVTSDFKGEGIAYLYIRMEYDQTVFAEGIPLFTAKIQGKKVYDPRSATTGYSANAALCIRDYLVSAYGLDNSGDTNDVSFQAAANACDESVTLSGSGTESRYEINGVIGLNQTPSDILADMMTACAGTLFWGQGQWHLKVGEYTSPVKTFTLDDLRGPITLDTKHSRRDNFNIVRGTFNDADQGYIRADYPEIRSSSFITDDNGVESALDLALPMTTSAAMAQRLAKMTLFRAREQMTFTADFGLEAFEVECGDIISLTIDRYGWSSKEFEVVGWKFKNDGDAGDLRVALTLRETSSAAFSWTAEESEITGNDSTLTDPIANLTITGLTASGGGATQGDGTFINSAILSWDQPSNRFVSFYEVDWKPTADSNYASTTSPDESIELSPLVDGVQYTFRVRAVTITGVRGAYATVTFTGGGDTTAPALPTSISATGGYKYITINWTNPADTDLNYVEIYENTSNTSSGASKVGISAGDSFTRTNLGLSQTRYYFLKSVDYSGNKSAFTSGVSATTEYLGDDFENGVRQLFLDQGLDIIEPVSSLPASGDFTGQQVFLTTDGKLYYWTGSQWDTVAAEVGTIDFSDLSGQLADAQIAVNTINGTKITDNTITSSEIAARTIQAGNIVSGTIGANEIAANAITANEIAANTITASQINSNTITANEIAANTITGGLLATSGIITSAAQINDAVVERAKIKDLAVNTIKIQDQAVTFPEAQIGTSGVYLNSSNGNYTTVSLSVTGSGAQAFVTFNASVTHTQVNQTTTNEGQYVKFNINAYDGSSVIGGLTGALVGGFNVVFYSLPFERYVSGSKTYHLKIQVTGGDAGYLKYFNPTITYLELKK